MYAFRVEVGGSVMRCPRWLAQNPHAAPVVWPWVTTRCEFLFLSRLREVQEALPGAMYRNGIADELVARSAWGEPLSWDRVHYTGPAEVTLARNWMTSIANTLRFQGHSALVDYRAVGRRQSRRSAPLERTQS